MSKQLMILYTSRILAQVLESTAWTDLQPRKQYQRVAH